MQLQLNQFSPMPIGKHKGIPVGDVARNDRNYLIWFQTNTVYDITDFEAITGIQKPAKTDEAMYKAANFTRTPTQHQQQSNTYTPPTPTTRTTSPDVTSASLESLSKRSATDHLYIVHLVAKSYRTLFNRSLFDDLLRIDPITPEEKKKQEEANLSPAAKDIKKTLDEGDDDLPF